MDRQWKKYMLISEPVDQAALVGMINHLNGLGLPVISVECRQAPVENEPSEQYDACTGGQDTLGVDDKRTLEIEQESTPNRKEPKMSLPSWNDTENKQAILAFVAAAADESGPDYVPPAERIAAFDNDGTLWVEQPAPAQTGFLLGKLVEQVKVDPSLAAEDPYKGIVTQDPEFLRGLAQQVPETVIAFLKGVGKAWEGTTLEAYEAEVHAFLAASMHPRYGCPWTDLIYQPMLELFDLLRENDWRVFVCSGGGRDFMRAYSEDALGVYKENIIGSAPEFAYVDGQLLRQNALHGNISLGPGKLEHIYARTGRTALFAGGNGDVDLEMLQEARFRLVVVHDDKEREYMVTAAAEKLLAAGEQGGWTMVSMKDDWKTIFKD